MKTVAARLAIVPEGSQVAKLKKAIIHRKTTASFRSTRHIGVSVDHRQWRGESAELEWTRVVDFVAICSYILAMKTVSIRDAKNRLTKLAREVERGETIVVTRNGRPAFDLVPHQKHKGLRLEAIDEFKRKHRIKAIVSYIADDFDEPLAEDFLLRPLPVDR